METEFLCVDNGDLQIGKINYSAVLIVITRKSVTEMLINPIIQTRTRYFRHAYHPTRDTIYFL
jgi:hypothetical protein